MKALRTSVCIVGGGPAGATTSLLLSQAGIAHVLIDKKRFPRDKVCGESYDGRVLHTLRRLSPLYLKELLESGHLQPSWGYRIDVPGASVRVPYQQQAPRMLINREVLDHYLMEQAKASPWALVLEDAAAKALDEQADGVSIQLADGRRVDAELAVMAVGTHSPLLPAASHRDHHQYVFSRGYFSGLPDDPRREVRMFALGVPESSLLYVCPAQQGIATVELGIPKHHYKKHPEHLYALSRAALQATPELREMFRNAQQLGEWKGATMSLPPWEKTVFSTGRTLVVGSSAFSVNPATGFGIGNAMTMARFAAEAIVAHRDRLQEAPRAYRKLARKGLRPILLFNVLVNLTAAPMLGIGPLARLAWKVLALTARIAYPPRPALALDASGLPTLPAYMQDCLKEQGRTPGLHALSLHATAQA
jgi:flavin-dependent dehydrogenase